MIKYPKPLIQILLKRLLLAEAVQVFCRLLFLLFNYNALNNPPFSEIFSAFAGGFVFDFVVLAYGFVLFALLHWVQVKAWHKKGFQLALKLLFMLSVIVILVLNFIDLEFFKITSKRSGIELFSITGEEGNHISLYIIDYWYLVLMLLATVWVVWRWYPKIPAHYTRIKPSTSLFFFILTIGFFILGARGGFSHKPVRPYDASRFGPTSLSPLTLNTPFQMIGTLESETLPDINYFTLSQADEIIQPYKNYKNDSLGFPKMNVVILLMESFGSDYCGFMNGRPRFTPFLDSLAKKSVVFMNGYASGTRSIEGVPSVFAGLPGLTETAYNNGPYQGNKLFNLGAILEKRGYQTSFYHGGHNGTMGFQGFLASSGLKNYFGKNEYPNPKTDFDGTWGIYDIPYFKYFCKQISAMKKPFFTGLFSLTSHHPYIIPLEYNSKFKGGPLPIHKAVEYSDYALKLFFEMASKEPWFNNTLFVITADHTSLSDNVYYGKYPGKFEVPIVFYQNGITPAIKDKTISHIDILPGILDYIHFDTTFFSLGSSPFRDDVGGAFMRHSNNFMYVNYPYVLVYDAVGKFAKAYRYKRNDPKDYPLNETDADAIEKLKRYSQAYLQEYITRLKNNKFH